MQVTLKLEEHSVNAICVELDQKIAALHNHIASAVEDPKHWSGKHTALSLVEDLRRYQAIVQRIRTQRREQLEAERAK